MNSLTYQSGFGNQFSTEAVDGVLPQGRNSPQQVAHGLYAELISGSAFTAPRAENRRTWLYRRQPSVVGGGYEPFAQPYLKTGAKDGRGDAAEPAALASGRRFRRRRSTSSTACAPSSSTATPMRRPAWRRTWCSMNRSMERRAFVNADGEMLIVPQQGALDDHDRARRAATSSPAKWRCCRAASRSRSA